MIWPDQNLVVVVELFKLVVGTHTDEYTAFCIFSRDGKLEMKEKGVRCYYGETVVTKRAY
jgi:hypothetical protein